MFLQFDINSNEFELLLYKIDILFYLSIENRIVLFILDTCPSNNKVCYYCCCSIKIILQFTPEYYVKFTLYFAREFIYSTGYI